MFVVHVITGLEQGGAEAMLEKLIYAARRANPELAQTVVSLGRMGPVGRRMRAAGVTVAAMQIRDPYSLVKGCVWLYRMLKGAPHAAVIQTWMYHADLLGGVLARLARRRVVWNVRQVLPSLSELKLSTRFVVRLCALCSRFIPSAIVCCASAASISHVRAGYSRNRWIQIDNGFDVEAMVRSEAMRRSLRAEWLIAEGEILIGLVGRIDPAKDHRTFLEAGAEVMVRRSNVRLALVGPGTEADPMLTAEIERLGLRDRVVRAGARRDIPAVMSALDVFVLSSRTEGFPNVLGEAMACELPAAVTDVGDVRRILAMDEYVCPPGDARALALRVDALCSLTPLERAAIGKRLRARVIEYFSIDEAWKQYRALYGDLASNQPICR